MLIAFMEQPDVTNLTEVVSKITLPCIGRSNDRKVPGQFLKELPHTKSLFIWFLPLLLSIY
ncbi:hypothetical protein CS542_04655 [Pedobacter sp. IW39]|nr:hypothetical protein CS542_04655 [Pedobacter sp. IW39]